MYVRCQDLSRDAGRVRKFEVCRLLEGGGEEEEVVGVVYMDLFARRSKFTGAAHFTVRCGFDNSELCSHMY